MQQTPFALSVVTLFLLVVWSSQWTSCEARGDHQATRGLLRARRSHAPDHKSMMHSHLSRKVFDRACAASRDTIDEIIACVTSSSLHTQANVQASKDCYKETFGTDFDPNDVAKHKELICNNRDKFENLTGCVYKKIGELLDPKEMEKFTESLVDVGLCIINALDG